MIKSIDVTVSGQGLYDISGPVASAIEIEEGLCTLFIRHTSASLLVQENYDASVKLDLECWLNKLVPENDSDYTHLAEGPDDMPSHIKSALTSTSLSIPVMAKSLMLGAWQGIFLWEHRHREGCRQVIMHMND